MRLEAWWAELATATLATLPRNTSSWPRSRIDVHRTNYREARIAALEQVYPAILKIVGVPCFRGWALAYLSTSVSTEADLNLHGADFPGWLRRRGTEHLGGLDYLPELARLERAVNLAYYAPEEPAVQRSCLRLTSSLKLISSVYPIDEIWQVNLSDEPAREVAASPGRRYLVVWRRERAVAMEAVSMQLFCVLRRLQQDARLDVILNSDLEPDDAARLIRRRWLIGCQDAAE